MLNEKCTVCAGFVWHMYHLNIIMTHFVSKVNYTYCVMYNKNGDFMIIKRLKDLREDKDLKQQDLADYLGITRSAYSNYENGIREVPLTVLMKIADFYRVSVDYLLGRTDER